jgi:hypothetical protein
MTATYGIETSLASRTRHLQKGNQGQASVRLNVMSDEYHFVICVPNEGYPASLELRKIHRTLPDKEAMEHQCISVIAESGKISVLCGLLRSD